jgi:hypothetical protein
VTPVSDLDEIREELDDLRGRIVMLEFDSQRLSGTTAGARAAARSADRQVAKARSEWREVVNNLEAGMSQILSLLTSPDACLQARRPENTQSASDSPLT